MIADCLTKTLPKPKASPIPEDCDELLMGKHWTFLENVQHVLDFSGITGAVWRVLQLEPMTRQAFKRKIEKEYSHDQKKGRIEREKNEVNQLRDSSNEMAQKEEETEYVFHIDDDVEIDCTIGVETKMLIDRAASKI
ncbi:hypothetical protein EVAR_47115_1 [Eumeta japonica]|uniref:Uncharacterized protein n=1 Tax=Eumeta variegata TaxID=151549 RepID=A0A4C1XV22_EUMVA|nr:hypothetical protein EVAR_47115_1 [Eumeta japonica]